MPANPLPRDFWNRNRRSGLGSGGGCNPRKGNLLWPGLHWESSQCAKWQKYLEARPSLKPLLPLTTFWATSQSTMTYLPNKLLMRQVSAGQVGTAEDALWT